MSEHRFQDKWDKVRAQGLKLARLGQRPRDPARLPPLGVHIRFMVHADLDDVTHLDAEAYPGGGRTAQDFLELMRLRHVTGLIAETKDDKPISVAFGIYRAYKEWIDLLDLVVAQSMRRRTVGTQIVLGLMRCLNPDRRRKLITEVDDEALPGHLLLKSLGFIAKRVTRDYFGAGKDSYHFEYSPFTEERS